MQITTDLAATQSCHSEVVNSSTSNAQCVLHMGLCSNDINIVLHSLGSPLPAVLSVDVAYFFPCSVFGNTLKPEHAMKTRNTTCILN